MKKLAIILSLIVSTPASAMVIKQGELSGSIILYKVPHEGYTCGIIIDKEGHIRHFITEKPSLLDITSQEVEPVSEDIEKDVYNTPWLDANYWSKCPTLSDLTAK